MRIVVTIQKVLVAFALLWLAGVMSIVAPTAVQAHAQHSASQIKHGQPHVAAGGHEDCAHKAHHPAGSKRLTSRSHGSMPRGCHCIESCLDEQSRAIVKPRSTEVITVALLQTKVMIIDHHSRVPAQSGPPPTARYTSVSRHLTGAVRVLVTNMRLRN